MTSGLQPISREKSCKVARLGAALPGLTGLPGIREDKMEGRVYN
jgi:hypothetical protein